MISFISIETQIIKATIQALLDAGYWVDVFDGEDIALERVGFVDDGVDRPQVDPQVLATMRATDEDYLRVYVSKHAPMNVGWVRFIYGNDDTEVINDYTTNLESVMKPVFDAITKFEETRGI